MSKFSSYSCTVCNKNCNSPEQLRIHQSSKTHLRRCEHALTLSDRVSFDCYQPWQISPRSDSSDLTCPTCSEHYSASEMLTHCCKSPPPIDTSSASPFVVVDFTDRLNPRLKASHSSGKSEFYCSTCDVPLYSQVNFDNHVKGKRHIDRQKQVLGFRGQEPNMNCSGWEMLSCSLQGIYVVEGGDDPYKGATFTKPSISALNRVPSSLSNINRNDSTSALFCSVCNLQLNSKSQLEVNNSSPSNLHYLNTVPSDAVTNIPSVKDSVPSNSTLCPVCDVPVGIASMGLHEMGRAHIFKSAMANCSRVYCFPSFSSSLLKFLTEISQSDTDIVLQMPFEDNASITSISLAIALGLVQENRATIDQPSDHCFAVWICSQKLAVSRRMGDARLLLKNLTNNRPRLVNIVKDTFSMDDRSCGITQHEIAFSTPGGFQNLLESVPNVQRAICALIFTDVELSVDNDPTERLLNHFVCLSRTHPTTRPRIIFITSGRIPCWPSLRSFSTIR
ncbi:zinc finger C2H2 type [Echinococcus multilocularis]|uniref:Zinc finger C2H2 type n=1 Tax=Echinococcus multilocularis TaxID=6211 RepID=A0A087VZ55_ECHMU|nr:zinc finger C2H2 type [Echinococcus multilocularis]